MHRKIAIDLLVLLAIPIALLSGCLLWDRYFALVSLAYAIILQFSGLFDFGKLGSRWLMGWREGNSSIEELHDLHLVKSVRGVVMIAPAWIFAERFKNGFVHPEFRSRVVLYEGTDALGKVAAKLRKKSDLHCQALSDNF